MSILSNNRFLQRVNPEIVRARTDAGTSLVSDHAVIQPLMRQMVDLGIADNLKVWVHSGLVDTRTSGSDLFIPKAYDISGEENDAVQATNDNQPKLVSDGMEFPASNYLLQTSYDNGTELSSPFTATLWINTLYTSATEAFIIRSWDAGSNNRCWAILVSSSQLSIAHSNDGLPRAGNIVGDLGIISGVGWTHIALTYNNSRFFPYINASPIDDYDVGALHNPGTNAPLQIGALRYEGFLNDARFFNTPISSTQIASIYNSTKGYYGIT